MLGPRTMETENAARIGGKPAVAAPLAGAGAAGARRTGAAALRDVGLNARGTGAGLAARFGAAGLGGASTESRMDTSEAASALPEIPAGIHDIDAGDATDPTCASEYAREIHIHQREAEVEKSARYGYMAHQTDINEKMRAILMDWLEEVHVKFKLMPETMFLTQNLIDRFLEKKIVVRSKLQLVGVTAMLIASKYEEIYAPEVRDFVYITDKAYSREQILAMEATMLNTLGFRVSAPTVFVFLNRYLKVAQADARLTQLATFLVERQLQEYKMLQHAPSKIAAAAVNIALRTLRGRGAWAEAMEFYSDYSQADLRATIVDIQDVMAAAVASSLQAVRKKHSSPKFGEVANIALALLD